MIVLPDPLIDDSLGLFGGVEPFGVEDFMTESSIEPFVISILPWRTRIDLDWFNANLGKPDLKRTGDKLPTIIGMNILRLPVLQQKWVESL